MNNVSAGKWEIFSSMLQKVLYQSYVWAFITNSKFEWSFNWNTTVHFPRFNKLTISDLATSYSAITVQDITMTDETFILDVRKAGAFEISDEDYIEMKVSPNGSLIESLKQEYANAYDTKVMEEYANAAFVIDDGDLTTATNGWSWNAATVTKSNIYDYITAVVQKMDENNMPTNNRWIILSPKEKRFLANAPELLRSTGMWDKVVTWWFMWEIDWLKVYYSNNMQTVSSVKHLLAWQGTPICFAANIKPVIQFVTSNLKPDKFTTTVKSQTKFNVKTFIEWTIKLIDVQIVNS